MVLKRYRWGRALLNEPDFCESYAAGKRMHGAIVVTVIIALPVCTRWTWACHQHLQEELPACLKKEIEKIEAKG